MIAPNLHRLISQIQGHLNETHHDLGYYFHPRGPRQKNHTLFLLNYHGNEGAIQEQKAPFAVSKVWKKQAASAHMKAGWWELEREGNVRAGGRHRECVLY